jgi:hypothetical protein
VASWLIFRVAHSLRIDPDMLVVTASPARTALKISQLTDGGMPPTYDSMHWLVKIEHVACAFSELRKLYAFA